MLDGRQGSRREDGAVGGATAARDGADRAEGLHGRPEGRSREARSRYQERSVAIRSSSCSMVAIAVGGPPQYSRSWLWILPCGFLVRWWCIATSVFSSLRHDASRS